MSFLFLQDSQISDLLEVIAHCEPDSDLDSFGEFCTVGDDAADSVAKQAVLAHPVGSDRERGDASHACFVSATVCALAARLLPHWPRCNLDGVERTVPEVPSKVESVAPTCHDWWWS